MVMIRFLIVCCFVIGLLPTRTFAASEQQIDGCELSVAKAAILSGDLRNALMSVIANIKTIDQRVVIIGQSTITLQICAPPEDSASAEDPAPVQHILDLLVDVLPRLSRHTGIRYQGTNLRKIVLVPSRRLDPISGDGIVNEESGIMYLYRNSNDWTVVHAEARYWAPWINFDERWMVEGYAQYLTELVMADRGEPPLLPSLNEGCEHVVLSEWDTNPALPTNCGSIIGAAMFHDLAQKVGEQTLRTTINRLTASTNTITHWQLFSALEQASGQDLTSVMGSRVFSQEENAWLAKRSVTRERLAHALNLAAQLGITLPPDVMQANQNGDFDAVNGTLDSVLPTLEQAAALNSRCQQMQLTCTPIWQPLPVDNATLAQLSARLNQSQELLKQYTALHDHAQKQHLSLPPQVVKDITAFQPEASEEMTRADEQLTQGIALDQRCQSMSTMCPLNWREPWSSGDIKKFTEVISETNRLLDYAGIVEQRCGDLRDACHRDWQAALHQQDLKGSKQVLEGLDKMLASASDVVKRCGELAGTCQATWHTTFQRQNLTAAQQLLDNMEHILARANAIVKHCGDIVDACWATWRATFQRQDLPSAQQLLNNMEQMLSQAQTVEAHCRTAGWPCSAQWRRKFTQDPNPEHIIKYLHDIDGALPHLQQTTFAVQEMPESWSSIAYSWFAVDSKALLNDAKSAFTKGDFKHALELADAATAAAIRAKQYGNLILLALTITLPVIVVVTVVYWRRRHPRTLSSPSKAHNTDLLAALLAQTPGKVKQSNQTTPKV